MREINRDIVCAVLVAKDKKVFLARKAPRGGGVYPSYWHIPGGGVEHGESLEQALAREIAEETGLEIRNLPCRILNDQASASAPKILQSGEEVLCHMRFFEYLVHLPTSSTTTKISLCSEFSEFGWFEASQLTAMQLVPAGVALFSNFSDQIFKCSF